jgi:hypothetical protein
MNASDFNATVIGTEFIGDFKCENCHRSMEMHTFPPIFRTLEDWNAQTIDIRCSNCGGGYTAHPRAKGDNKRVIEVKKQAS